MSLDPHPAPVRSRSRSTLIGALLVAGLTLGLGCSQTSQLDPESLLKGRGGSAGGSSDGWGGAAGSASGGPANGTGSATTTAIDTPPQAGGTPIQCKTTEDGKRVCVTCIDSSGKVVRDGCYDKESPPTGASCAETRAPDGSLCVVCTDEKGQVVKRGCQAPDPTNCTGKAPPPVGQPGTTGDIKCTDEEVNGGKCTVCVDAKGTVVKKACAGGAPAPSDAGAGPGDVTCKDTNYADGTTCTVCTDAKGEVIKKGCWSPVPTPTPAPAITCKDYDQNGAHCTVCVDANGKVVKQGCWDAPVTTPNVTCQPYTDKGAMCVICIDAKGQLVKQSCDAPTTMPAPPPPK